MGALLKRLVAKMFRQNCGNGISKTDRDFLKELTAFNAQPLDLHSVPLMNVGFVAICQLAEHCLPCIRFLFIGSRLCSALLSGTSRWVLFHPCASLSLHVHRVVKRTCTSKLSIMLGTQNNAGVPIASGRPQCLYVK